MTIDALRTPDDRFDNLPQWDYAPKYIDDLRGYEGLRMHYVDEGPKDAVPFLCLHGQPTWSYLYRKMAKVFLDAGHRFIAPDFYGFGRSDKPTAEETYTFDFHRNALLAFVERLDLKNTCLTVQDWGGILGLTLPMESPARYSRLIVMNTSMPIGEDAPEGFAGWRAYNRKTPDMAIGKLLKRGKADMTDAEAAAYDAPFPDATYKAGVRRFPELVMLKESPELGLSDIASHGVETTKKAREFWRTNWTGDSFMAYGVQDMVFSARDAEKLRAMIKGCPAPMNVEGGHFVQEWGAPIASGALKAFAIE